MTAEQSNRKGILTGVIAFAAVVLWLTGGAFAQTFSAPQLLHANGTTDSGGDSRPQIVTDGAGNWVAVWDSFEDLSNTMGTDYDIFVARSSDNGATWTAADELNSDATTDTEFDRRPILVTDGAGSGSRRGRATTTAATWTSCMHARPTTAPPGARARC